MTDARPPGADEATFIAAARSGDTARFTLVTERHRRELQVHCYRMLANYEDAQDVTQETFLRAWNKRESFKGHAALRTWLYRIATNACLDFLEKRNARTPVPSGLSLIMPTQPPTLKPSSPAGSWMTPSSVTFSLTTIFPILVLLRRCSVRSGSSSVPGTDRRIWPGPR